MHPINISHTTVQHTRNWKGIQILTIWLISKGLLFFYTPCSAGQTFIRFSTNKIHETQHFKCSFKLLFVKTHQFSKHLYTKIK